MKPGLNRAAIVRDRLDGLSLTEVAKKHRVSRATVCRLVKESGRRKKTSVSHVAAPQSGVEFSASRDRCRTTVVCPTSAFCGFHPSALEKEDP